MGNNELTGVIYSILVEKTKGTLLRNWDDLDLWMLAESVEGSLSQKSNKLNENQQIVLEWLKDDFKKSENPIDSLESLANEVLHVETFQTCISSTYDDLTNNEQFQVLAAFAEWGMKEVAE